MHRLKLILKVIWMLELICKNQSLCRGKPHKLLSENQRGYVCLMLRLSLIKDGLGNCINGAWEGNSQLWQKPGAKNLGGLFQLPCLQLTLVSLLSDLNCPDEDVNFCFLVYSKSCQSLVTAELSKLLAIQIKSTVLFLDGSFQIHQTNIP